MSVVDPDKFVEEQRASWDAAADGWKKWDWWLDSNMAAIDHHLLERAKVSEGGNVLDLGSGTGNPAILAARRVGANGKVTGLDLSERMLSVAREKLEAAGIVNASFHSCDVCSIPHGDDEFDAATSRFCFMFLPRLDNALSETRRVLKKGGRFAAAVWAAPEKNPSMSLPMRVLKEFLDIPQPPPSAPGLFSLGRPGALREKMEKAGYYAVTEEEIPVEWKYSSSRQFLECMRDMAAPMRTMFAKLAPRERAEAEMGMLEEAERFREGEGIRIPGEAIIVSGEKA
ncbi:MAG: class I SAM-dependent methyltransferase [Candidatus Nitrospinota bacterium M3_3B_026]